MSRIAEARARAGHGSRVEGEVATWEAEQRAAIELLLIETNRSAVQPPQSTRPPTSDLRLATEGPDSDPVADRTAGDTNNRTLSPAPSPSILDTTVQRLFLSSARPIQSALFCTPAGEPMTDVAWRVAERLAEQSGRRVAFVEDPNNRIATRRSPMDHLIARVGWYSVEALRQSGRSETAKRETLGETVADLLGYFDFAILNATAAETDVLVTLASEVDGVIAVLNEPATHGESPAKLSEIIRSTGVDLLDTIYVNGDAIHAGSLRRG